MKATIIGLSSMIALSACAGSYSPQYFVNEIQVYNNTRDPVREVSLRVGDRLFECDNIAPLGLCGNRFARRSFQPGTLEIQWTLGNSGPQRQTLETRVPAYFSVGIPLRGIVEIDSPNEVSLRFDQEPRLD